MNRSTRSVVFDGALKVVQRPWPGLAEGEALIRLRVAGICNTDLEIMRGYKGFTGGLGHEFVGEVIAGDAAWVGQRVVGEINIGCGSCDMCRAGVPEHCRTRRTLGLFDYDGAFADVFKLPLRNLHRVPDTVSDDAAVFVEPLAAACQIPERVHIRPGQYVVVIGAGKLGLLAAQVLRLMGCDLTVLARHERQRALLDRWGIRAASRAEIPEGTIDVVVDCTGNASGFQAALEMVRPRGTIVLKSTYAHPEETDLTRLVVEEITVVGSRCGPFAAALRLLQQQLVDVESLIEARYVLDEAAQALAYAAKSGVLKVLLEP